MPIPQKYLAEFQENGIFHVYNRTNNKERLFLSDENYHFFLKKYYQYLSPLLDTFCWCLLPTHFHSLIRIKSANAIAETICKKEYKNLFLTEKKFIGRQISISELIEQRFKRFFQSYAQSFNKVYHRNGNLFYRPFKRRAVQDQQHFISSVIYIHTNPQKHGIVNDFAKYEWSSWQTLITDTPTPLLRQELMEQFGCRKQFIKAHYTLRNTVS